MEEKVVIMNSSEAKNLNENEYFTAYFNEWDESGRECKASWAVSVKKDMEKCSQSNLQINFFRWPTKDTKNVWQRCQF